MIEIPRKKYKEDVISASRARILLAEKDYEALREYVPDTTLKYIADVRQ